MIYVWIRLPNRDQIGENRYNVKVFVLSVIQNYLLLPSTLTENINMCLLVYHGKVLWYNFILSIMLTDCKAILILLDDQLPMQKYNTHSCLIVIYLNFFHCWSKKCVLEGTKIMRVSESVYFCLEWKAKLSFDSE